MTTLEPGDLVTINPYQVQAMNGEWSEGYASGKVGIVMDIQKGPNSWDPVRLNLRINLEKRPGERHAKAITYGRDAKEVTLYRVGPGRFELGVTHPFSEEELYYQRRQAFLAKVEAHDIRHQGFSNPATWAAALYIDNDERAYNYMRQKVRANGTVNPKSVEKCMQLYRLKVDDWTLECPLHIPEEFKGMGPMTDFVRRMHINWDELAKYYHKDNWT